MPNLYALRAKALDALADCLEAGHGADDWLDSQIRTAMFKDCPRSPSRFTCNTAHALSLFGEIPDSGRKAGLHHALDAWAKAHATLADWPRFVSAAALRAQAAKLKEPDDAA
jgi:hypothetical protein